MCVKPYFETLHSNPSATTQSIFINGINNTPENALEISKPFRSFSHNIEHLVNPTDGFLQDHMRILQAKIGFGTEAAEVLAKKLVTYSHTDCKILLIGHSEGGLIIERALEKLKKIAPDSLMKRISVHTLGSSSFYRNTFGVKKLTHHVTLFDFLCFFQSPLVLILSLIGFIKLLFNKIIWKKETARIGFLNVKFYRPRSFNIHLEHIISKGLYNEILHKKLTKENHS